MKELRRIYENLRLTTNEAENQTAYEMIHLILKDYGNDPLMIGMIMYSFGKMIGKRKERCKKNRASLLEKYPNMSHEIKNASDEVIRTVVKLQNFTQEEQTMFIDALSTLRNGRE